MGGPPAPVPCGQNHCEGRCRGAVTAAGPREEVRSPRPRFAEAPGFGPSETLLPASPPTFCCGLHSSPPPPSLSSVTAARTQSWGGAGRGLPLADGDGGRDRRWGPQRGNRTGLAGVGRGPTAQGRGGNSGQSIGPREKRDLQRPPEGTTQCQTLRAGWAHWISIGPGEERQQVWAEPGPESLPPPAPRAPPDPPWRVGGGHQARTVASFRR